MASLRSRMARHGFESNDDYEYRVRCLLSYPTRGLRCLAVEGDSGRRKTAFATALARALEWQHVLYHDFAASEPLPGRIEVPDLPAEEGEAPVQLTPFDRTVSEACAFSEAEGTVLIVDQLQEADFAEHLRLYRFVTSAEWQYPLATLRANPRKFLLVLVSEAPLFHSLQKECFRIWTDPETPPLSFRPGDFGLDDDASPLIEALITLFEALRVSPTQSAFERILQDLLHRAGTADHLRGTLFGWVEGITWDMLAAEDIGARLDAVIEALQNYLGHDQIELTGE
ncbi:MAG: hypothetical protein AAGE01_06040 [Pseudomonadota bacterium]